MENAPSNNKASSGTSALNAGLGAFLGEKWAVWYDGSESPEGSAAAGYLQTFGLALFEQRAAAELRCVREAYTPRKVFIYEAPNV